MKYAFTNNPSDPSIWDNTYSTPFEAIGACGGLGTSIVFYSKYHQGFLDITCKKNLFIDTLRHVIIKYGNGIEIGYCTSATISEVVAYLSRPRYDDTISVQVKDFVNQFWKNYVNSNM